MHTRMHARMHARIHAHIRAHMCMHTGSEHGADLLEVTISTLRDLGVAYVLTLADDRGSGKLRAWYVHAYVHACKLRAWYVHAYVHACKLRVVRASGNCQGLCI